MKRVPAVIDVAKQIRDLEKKVDHLESDRAILTNIVLMLSKRMSTCELRFPIEEVAAIGMGHLIWIDQEGTTTIVHITRKSERH